MDDAEAEFQKVGRAIPVVTAFSDAGNSPEHKMFALRGAVPSLDNAGDLIRGLVAFAYLAIDQMARQKGTTAAEELQRMAVENADILEKFRTHRQGE